MTSPRLDEYREPKSGNVVRVTSERTARCVCRDCCRDFPSTGAAASHARSARHVIDVVYATTFAFVPAERVGVKA